MALLASLVSDARDRQVVNVRNAGTFPFLDDDAVIEVPARGGRRRCRAVPGGPAAPADARPGRARVGLRGAGRRRGACAAAADRVRAALLAHPLVGQYDLAGQLADRLIAENARYLAWAGGTPQAAATAGP